MGDFSAEFLSSKNAETFLKNLIKFILHGKRLKGMWTLTHFKDNNWLLIKDKDYFKWAITNQKGGKVFNIDEERYLVTTSEIPTLNWIMIGLTPVKELTRAGRNIIQIIYMVGIIAVLLNIVFSLRVAYSVTKPLTELTRTMSSFGKGNLSVKVPVGASVTAVLEKL